MTGFILRGIFLGARSEIDWFLHGMRTIFPEAWRDFVEHLPESERVDLLGNYYRRLIDRSPDSPSSGGARLEPLRGGLLDALSDGARTVRVGPWRLRARALAYRGALLRPRHVRARRLAVGGSRPHPPASRTIVQGRYDIVCPPVTADALARAWPEARYVVVPDAGHSALEPGIRAALVNATESFRLSTSEDLFAPRFPWET